jgi:hypothetical protein
VTTPRLLALGAAVLLTAAPLCADEKKDAPPAATVPAPAAKNALPPTEGPVIVLPKMDVSATRLREIDVTIKRLEKQISREKKQLEKTTLDDTLNSEKVSKAAALFGGKSTVQRASVAAVRIESMEKELQLLETLRTPMTKSDRELVEQLVEDQRKYRRELDTLLR